MLLEKKNAVIYGAGGAIGSAVAHAFARDGAKVFLAGRTLAPIQAVASQIARDGGSAEAARVDALDEQAVERHIGDVARKARRIDILFNAIGMEDTQGTPLLEMSLDDFVHPVVTATTTQFITARAVARRMVAQGSGVIMSITAAPSPAPNVGGFRAACSAIEGLWRSLASELGPHGIRLVILRSAGSPDAPGVQGVLTEHAGAAGMSVEEFVADMGRSALLRRLPLLAEIANAATLFASDRAGAMTGAIANITCGALLDL
jgi:NAD(P)-dependent dehydrogenase (short-subunit alcohol dehydrogenase family)